MTNVIGIDPGKKGAIALIAEDHQLVVDYDSDEHAKHTLRLWLDLYDVEAVALEKVWSRAHDGRKATTTFMQHVGFLKGLLFAADAPVEEVLPQKWQSHMLMELKRLRAPVAHKNKPSLDAAPLLYPALDFKGPRGGLKDGRADAVMIAHWAKHGRKR